MRNPILGLALLALVPGVLSTPEASLADSGSIGLSEVRSQRFDNEDLFFFVPAVGDHFAWAVAAGDFDGDGADDLATGIPFDEGLVGGFCDDCGIVVVRYGALREGLLGGPADTVLYQGLSGSPDPVEPEDRFGFSLAAGDFNGDDFDDLAVGIPRDPNGGVAAAGAVQVYFGSAAGIQTQGSEFLDEFLGWQEVDPRVCSEGEFGWALTAGNFDGDAFDDLAIGAPRGCLAHLGTARVGEVFVAHGSADGLLPLAGYGISEDSNGVFGEAAGGERFGGALAAGDFDADGDDDLAIGVPNEGDNGSVYVILGSPFGLIFADSVFWAPGALGLVPEPGDRLGFSLVVGDFDGDGHDDLAIGDPSEDLGPANEILDVGAVSVAFGAPGGFDLGRTRNLTQGAIYGEPTADTASEQFGWALAAGDFDGDGRDDLAVGHPAEDVPGPGQPNVGATTVLMGADGAGFGQRFGFLTPGRRGLAGSGQPHQDFARALAAGDFDGDGFSDLAIGAPWFDSGGLADVGYEIVLYGALFADGFEVASTDRWSTTAP